MYNIFGGIPTKTQYIYQITINNPMMSSKMQLIRITVTTKLYETPLSGSLIIKKNPLVIIHDGEHFKLI